MSDRYSPSSRSGKQRQAMAVLLLGVLVAIVAIVLALRDNASPSGESVAIQQEGGRFPVISLQNINNGNTLPSAGHPAPNFVIHMPDGSTTTLADLKGKPVVINIWATWCPPCRMEMPHLVRAYETYKDEGLVIIAVDDAESEQAVADFVQEHKLTMPVVIDQSGELLRAYKTQSLPSSFFIDRNGVIQVRWIGMLTPDALERSLKTIL